MDKDIKDLKLNNKIYRVKETLQAIYEYQRLLNKKENKDIGELEKEMLMVYCILKNANRTETDDYNKFKMSWDEFNDIIIDNMDALQELNKDSDSPENKDDKKK